MTRVERAVRKLIAATETGHVSWLNDSDAYFSAQLGEHVFLLRIAYDDHAHLHMGYAGNCEAYIASTFENSRSLVSAVRKLLSVVRSVSKRPQREVHARGPSIDLMLELLPDGADK